MRLIFGTGSRELFVRDTHFPPYVLSMISEPRFAGVFDFTSLTG